METIMLKVSSKSVPNKVASAMVGIIKEGKNVELQSVGAGAINQTVKAVGIANKYLKDEDFELWFKPVFVDIKIDDNERTAIKGYLKKVPKEL